MSAQAKSFPYIGRNYQWPSRLDDDQFRVAAAGGRGAVPQAATTAPPMIPGGSSSHSSSSEEFMMPTVGVGGAGAGTTAPLAGPIRGAGGNQARAGAARAGAANAGDDSGNVEAAVGGPVQAQPQAGAAANNAGDDSNQVDPGPFVPAPLNFEAQTAIKEKKSARTSTGLALATVGIVASVAATSVVVYKYKDTIKAKIGF